MVAFLKQPSLLATNVAKREKGGKKQKPLPSEAGERHGSPPLPLLSIAKRSSRSLSSESGAFARRRGAQGSLSKMLEDPYLLLLKYVRGEAWVGSFGP